jgi:hypothetical protein
MKGLNGEQGRGPDFRRTCSSLRCLMRPRAYRFQLVLPTQCGRCQAASSEGRAGTRHSRLTTCQVQYQLPGTRFGVRPSALGLTKGEERSHPPYPSPFHGRGPDAEHRGPRRGPRTGKRAHQVYMPGEVRSSTFQRIRFGLTQTAIRQFGNTAIIHVPGPTDGLDSIPFPLHNSYRC